MDSQKHQNIAELIFEKYSVKDAGIRSLLRYFFEQQDLGSTHLDLSKYLLHSKLDQTVESLIEAVNREGIAGESDAPFVIYKNLLTTNRLFHYEQKIASILKSISQQAIKPQYDLKSENIAQILGDLVDESQLKVIHEALASNIFCLSGGPGTGKTRTLVALIKTIIALQLGAKSHPIRLIVLAPTAKAILKLQHDCEVALKDFSVYDLPELKFLTVHKLLRFTAYHILPNRKEDDLIFCDWLIVEESSMLSLEMLYLLLKFVAKGSKILFSGDKNQLPPVSLGSPFKDLVDFLEATHLQLQSVQRIGYHFLQTNYRQKNQIGQFLSKTSEIADIRNENELSFDQILKTELEKVSESIVWKDESQIDSLIKSAITSAELLSSSENPQSMLDTLSNFIILTLNRIGSRGCQYLNDEISKNIIYNSSLSSSYKQNWQGTTIFHGMPFIIKRNDYNSGLLNGSIGVFFKTSSGLKAYLKNHTQDLTELSLSNILIFEPAYAITVHESQGSEFDKVSLLLANLNSELNNFAALYTGMSRAKSSLTIYGSQAEFIECLNHFNHRTTGLIATLKDKFY